VAPVAEASPQQPEDTGESVREAAVEAARVAVVRYCEAEVNEALRDIVREVAREVVPGIAERLIREEIARLRAEYDLETPPA
jgi:hypothetical protein